MYAASALQTEAMACLSAIRWARTTNFSQILVITDSVVLVQFLRSQTMADITIHHTLKDIREEAGTFQWCRILKVHRGQVQHAHTIALNSRNNRFNSL